MTDAFRYALALSVLLAATAPAAARQPLVTDRPGNGNAATTVGKETLQVESSVNYLRDHHHDLTTQGLSFPTTLRLGINHWLEFRVGGDLARVEDVTAQGTRAGVTDLSLGFKAEVVDASGLRPQLALLAHWTLPTGRSSLSSGAVEPLFLLLAAWQLPQDFGLLLNIGLDAPPGQSSGTVTRFNYLGLISYMLPFWRGHVGVFAEAFGRVALRNEEISQYQIDAGLILLLTPDFQLDMFTQHGLTQDSTDFQVALGLSYRFGGQASHAPWLL